MDRPNGEVRSVGIDAHALFASPAPAAQPDVLIDPRSYEEVIVFFSGKDSLACLLHLIELGVDPARIEIHHHLVDGREGDRFMDWPISEAWVDAVAESFGIRSEKSWRVGGFEREMLRENCGTAPIAFPVRGEGLRVSGGDRSEPNTRRRFPQTSASLQVRWCSSSLKIEVAARYLNNDPRFADGRRRLVVTGERAEESTSRACYASFEPHRCDRRNGARVHRWLDHWRPVHQWSEQEVWAIIQRHGVVPHPVYQILSRCSCAGCVFSGPDQWATLRRIDPPGFGKVADYEQKFGVTIHRERSVIEQADRGTPLAQPGDLVVEQLMSTEWRWPIRVDPKDWTMPRGAFKGSGGPS